MYNVAVVVSRGARCVALYESYLGVRNVIVFQCLDRHRNLLPVSLEAAFHHITKVSLT